MDWSKLGEVTDWSDLDKVMTGKDSSKKDTTEMKHSQENNKESLGDSSKNPILDEDVGDWSDMKQFDDDHDPNWFEEEEKRLAAKYDGNFIKVKYTEQGRPGYFCEICLAEMNAKKSLESHCEGMKHLKKKALFEKAKNGDHHEENESTHKGGFKEDNKQKSSNSRRDRSPQSRPDHSSRNTRDRRDDDRRGRFNDRRDSRSRDRRGEGPYGQRNDRRDHPYRRPDDQFGRRNYQDSYRQSRDPYERPEPQFDRSGPPMDRYGEIDRRDMPVDHYGRSDRAPMDRYGGPDRPSHLNDRHGPPMDRHGPPIDRYGPPIDRQGTAMDRSGPPMDRSGPPMDRSGPPMDRSGPPMDRSGPPMDRNGPPMDRNGPPTDRYGPTDRYEGASKWGGGSTNPYNAPDPTISRSEPLAAAPVVPKEKLNGGTTGVLLSKLSACYIKDEDDAELALNVISALCSSLREYNTDKGEKKIAELLMEAELKMNTLKALKVGLKLLKNPSHILATVNASPLPTQQIQPPPSASYSDNAPRQSNTGLSQGNWNQSYPYNGPAGSYPPRQPYPRY